MHNYLNGFFAPGFRIGHAQDDQALTGCTVILCEAGATGGVDQRGGAPGTRETDLLRPMHLVEKVHAVLLSGGSAFGLDAASGVMRYLAERQVGFDVQVARVPIVPAAVIFDLNLGRSDIRPDADMGYRSCLNAGRVEACSLDKESDMASCAQGNVGAGTGASVGKILGLSRATKSGLGCASIQFEDGLVISALAVVNALGEVVNPLNGSILAGVRKNPKIGLGEQDPQPFLPTLELLDQLISAPMMGSLIQNTVIGVVATNARLSKEQANLVAQMAQDGLARAIRPSHTLMDGDTIFALASGEIETDLNLVGAYGAEMFSQAILNAVRAAQPAGGLPCATSITPDNDPQPGIHGD